MTHGPAPPYTLGMTQTAEATITTTAEITGTDPISGQEYFEAGGQIVVAGRESSATWDVETTEGDSAWVSVELTAYSAADLLVMAEKIKDLAAAMQRAETIKGTV